MSLNQSIIYTLCTDDVKQTSKYHCYIKGGYDNLKHRSMCYGLP